MLQDGRFSFLVSTNSVSLVIDVGERVVTPLSPDLPDELQVVIPLMEFLQRLPSVSLRVLAGESGRPVAEAAIAFWDASSGEPSPNGWSERPRRPADVAAAGESYRVVVRAPRFAPAVLQFSLVSAGRIEKEIMLSPASMLEGFVTASEGIELTKVGMFLFPFDTTARPVFFASVQRDATFVFEGLNPGPLPAGRHLSLVKTNEDLRSRTDCRSRN